MSKDLPLKSKVPSFVGTNARPNMGPMTRRDFSSAAL
jgi:hypothetical protein